MISHRIGVRSNVAFLASSVQKNDQFENKKNKKTVNLEKKLENPHVNKKEDPLEKYPLRLCAYTNEVGAAISPVPGIGPTLFKLSWVPALMYFGADIYNKYAQGENGDYAKPSKSSAFEQAVFQGLASVILPTAAVLAGQNITSRLSKYLSKDKMDVRAKEDILSELKRDLNQDKLRKQKNKINEIIKQNSNLSNEELTELDEIRQLKKEFAQGILDDIKIESETLMRQRKNKGIFKRILGFFFHSHHDCEHVSRIKPEGLEKKIKPFLQEQVDNLVNTRIALQRALNPDGTLNDNSKHLEKSMLKKVKKLIDKNKENRDIIDKSSFVVKECVVSEVNKTALRLSVVKIIGGFAALAIMAKPIDKFVENIIIDKYVEPQLNNPKLFKNKNTTESK